MRKFFSTYGTVIRRILQVLMAGVLVFVFVEGVLMRLTF